jgi:hypothetical protein
MSNKIDKISSNDNIDPSLSPPSKRKIGRPPKYSTDEERMKARNESILKSVHKLRYTEEEVQRKLKLYEEKLRSKMAAPI